MQKKRLLLIGGGGHCRSCIEVLDSTQQYEIVGAIDVPSKLNTEVLPGFPGCRVVGSDADLPSVLAQADEVLITLGFIRSPDLRIRAFENLQKMGARFATAVSPRAAVSRYSSVGAGTIALHFSVVNAGARVGSNGILNTSSVVEHDVVIGDHCHISTGARVNGGAKLGDRVFVGSGAIVRESVSICSDVVIGAGAVVVSDIAEPGTYVGCPARRLR